MALTIEDRWAISETICRHGHLVDAGELNRLDELFTKDVIYDISDFTGESLVGVDAIREAAIALGERNPLGHHVTNVVISEENDDRVVAHSKGIGINSDGSSGTVVYQDTVVRVSGGWRISHRKVIARQTPLKR
jgi:3-phenylpropionate/cinnamic acid dioxygenase small subunit